MVYILQMCFVKNPMSRCYYYPCFSDEETEAQKNESLTTHPKSSMAEWDSHEAVLLLSMPVRNCHSMLRPWKNILSCHTEYFQVSFLAASSGLIKVWYHRPEHGNNCISSYLKSKPMVQITLWVGQSQFSCLQVSLTICKWRGSYIQETTTCLLLKHFFKPVKFRRACHF